MSSDGMTPRPVTRQLTLPAIRTPQSPMEIREMSKSYVVTTVQRRLYQARFRNAVLKAYRERCAVCGLHVRALLDAVHIDEGFTIRDGIALCATHHRAFDAHILSYDSDYRIRIELPERFAAGEGERAMLMAFAGKRLELPADEE